MMQSWCPSRNTICTMSCEHCPFKAAQHTADTAPPSFWTGGTPLLTPMHVEIILRYHSCRERMQEPILPAVRNAFDWLIAEGILQPRKDNDEGHELSERGRVWLSAILSIPFPSQKWEIQWPAQ